VRSPRCEFNLRDTDMQSIKVDVLLNLKDHLRANYWTLFKRYKLTEILILAFIVVGSVGVFLFPEFFKNNAATRNSNFLVVLLGAFLLIHMFVIGWTYWETKQNLESRKSLFDTYHYIFAKEKIEVSSRLFFSRYNWEMIREAIETQHNFLLYLSRNQFLIIPRSSFQSSDEINQFKELLKEILGSKAKFD
jgi:YcxB-like protein